MILRTTGLFFDMATSQFTAISVFSCFPNLLLLHFCLLLFIHWCMFCSLSSSTLVLVLVAHLPPPWVVLAAVFLLCCLNSSEVFVILARLSMLTKAACFLSHSYTSPGFQGETRQKAEKQREGGEAEKQTHWLWNRLAIFSPRCMWERVLVQPLWHKLWCAGKRLAHMMTGSLFILRFDSLFCVHTHIFPSLRGHVFSVSQE